MVAKRSSPASGNKRAGKTGGRRWGKTAAVAEAKQEETDEGFTTDSAGGAVSQEAAGSETEAEAAPAKTRRGRKAAEGHTPAQDASDDGAVNLTNMTSDLVHGVERLERLAEEQQALKDDAKEIIGELKSKGYSTKIIRKVLVRRAMDPDKRREEDSLLELYEEALQGA